MRFYKEDLMKKALADLLSTGEVEIHYTKKNGELRTAAATLCEDLIIEWGGEMPKGRKYSPGHIFNYYDLNSNGWRSFDINNFIEAGQRD